ncbi:MAG: dTMP kinase, partial [Anaerolineae bacterium]|nr:dTMP kinase [Anaerolineae bacterium]
MFITLEGPDGSGKTTQIRLLAEWLREQDYEVVLTREPGGTDIGDQIRVVLHDPRNTAMDARTEILLYSASRAQHVAQRIRPALAAGKIVISDRYADSTLAYQGYGRGLNLETLRTITAFATGGLMPDLTLYLDITSQE